MTRLLSVKKTREAIAIMAQCFPHAACELVHRNAYELLIAVILSAQATDVSVNKVTPNLFQKYPTPEALAQSSLEEVMNCIRTLGLYRNKAINIRKCAEQLVTEFNSTVPSGQKELESLAGVGRKTANVVRSVAFGIPALAVDTHVERVSKRLGICSKEATVIEVEETLKKKLLKSTWSDAHHYLIFWGRYHCTARKPKCEECPLLYLCPEGQSRV